MRLSPISHILGIAMLAATPCPSVGQPASPRPERTLFTAPFQPWASPDGRVHLLRPAVAQPSTSDAPLGAMMSPGWRLIWDGSQPTPGQMAVRLALNVSPSPPEKTASEVLQVGVSRARRDVRTCLTYGLKGGSARHLPDRVINARRYAAWSNGDAGMSQQVSAIDLRAVVGGACYAIERFSYAESASDGDPSVSLPQATGAALLDRTLASLQLGRLPPGRVLQPKAMRPPPGAVAR